MLCLGARWGRFPEVTSDPWGVAGVRGAQHDVPCRTQGWSQPWPGTEGWLAREVVSNVYPNELVLLFSRAL